MPGLSHSEPPPAEGIAVDFGLNEDQEAFRAAVRTFAREKLAPGYLQRAKSEWFPWEVHREVAALGVFGLLAGEAFNPLAHEDFVAAGLVVEELAYAQVKTATRCSGVDSRPERRFGRWRVRVRRTP